MNIKVAAFTVSEKSISTRLFYLGVHEWFGLDILVVSLSMLQSVCPNTCHLQVNAQFTCAQVITNFAHMHFKSVRSSW